MTKMSFSPTAAPPVAAASRRRFLSPLNPPMRDWQGKTAWIIGASSGIGRATASALHARGARVVVSARGEEALAQFVSEHPGAIAMALDVGDAESVRRAAEGTLPSGPVDCVMYCAGYYREMRADTFDLAQMLQHQEVNYAGALRVLDAVLPNLLARGAGHISLVSSVAGFRGLPNSIAYGPTKAALTNLAETLWLDLSDRGIGVSVIHPGFVDTPLTARNTFSMPALITPAEAAGKILDGWREGVFDIHFPKRFTLWLKLLQLLPARLHFAAVRRVTGL